ncbi:MAG: metalloregulator ArsR/SmtB family transcription factor [Bacteroidetes bacterium]|nr:metalloregulator ArsR/SmtB family transcription factor [Bacteroidota bacterium]
MEDLAKMFKALSDPSRLRILNLLYHSGELCVCDIIAVMGVTQTKVSRHLAYLKRAGLVTDRRQGLWMLYSLPRPVDEMHRRMIDALGLFLKTHQDAQRDARRLAVNISSGCCATFARVLPAANSARRGKSKPQKENTL